MYDRAISIIDNALYHLRQASSYLSSAGNWGVLDLLGGGLISTFAKHSKMDEARREIESAKAQITQLKYELQSEGSVPDLNIDVNSFLHFADYFFDGLVADWLVQSRIRDAQQQVSDATARLNGLKYALLSAK